MARVRRRIVQVLAAVLYNANIGGFAKGMLYRGGTKNICAPGLNCYSCPGATMACPIGSLQQALGNFPKAFPLYVAGFLLLFGALFGRAVCAFLCPFGLVQELLYKIPGPKIKKSKFTRALSWLKYVILAVFVIWLPLFWLQKNGVAVPAFCKYICPAGILEGAIPLLAVNSGLFQNAGGIFALKVSVFVGIIILSVFVFRVFCRFLCPLGAIYSIFNPIAILGIKVDRKKCIDCGKCVRACKMDVKRVNDRECIRCGECREVCPCGALDGYFARRKKK